MSLQNLQRHSDLWFEDGNVVLVAENTMFRLHKGVLARHSEVFHDMFSIPQPQQLDDAYDGCPVVRMSEEADELSTVLEILYDGGGRFYKDSIPAPFRSVTAALHLGSKLMIDTIREEAVARLALCFPASLADFHDYISMSPTHRPVTHYHVVYQRPIVMEQTDAIAVFHLARVFGLRDIGRAALYTCTQLPSTVLFQAVRSDGGAVRTFFMSDLQTCVEAKSLMQDMRFGLSGALLQTRYISPANCTRKGVDGIDLDCDLGILSLVAALVENEVLVGEPLDALCSLKIWLKGIAPRYICDGCLDRALSLQWEARKQVWKKLGDLYDTFEVRCN
ncbi:hypothetical protein BDW22DRAFT_1330030 [Trametopsis cervina]|nr:hypothetical protein BDW22DRAFT_1330030 [Trametopsis cervina]